MVIQGADGDHKDMGPIVLASNDQLGLDDSMSADGTETSDPPLCGREGCTVDLPFIRLLHKSGGGLELGKVGSVTQLCLGVASDNLVLFCERNPLFNLLIASLRVNDRDEGYN